MADGADDMRMLSDQLRQAQAKIERLETELQEIRKERDALDRANDELQDEYDKVVVEQSDLEAQLEHANDQHKRCVKLERLLRQGNERLQQELRLAENNVLALRHELDDAAEREARLEEELRIRRERQNFVHRPIVDDDDGASRSFEGRSIMAMDPSTTKSMIM